MITVSGIFSPMLADILLAMLYNNHALLSLDDINYKYTIFFVPLN